jgi:hypothetical protein
MTRNTERDGKSQVDRKATRLTLNRETLHHLSDASQVGGRATKTCTGTCIITGHPCPPPCG